MENPSLSEIDEILFTLHTLLDEIALTTPNLTNTYNTKQLKSLHIKTLRSISLLNFVLSDHLSINNYQRLPFIKIKFWTKQFKKIFKDLNKLTSQVDRYPTKFCPIDSMVKEVFKAASFDLRMLKVPNMHWIYYTDGLNGETLFGEMGECCGKRYFRTGSLDYERWHILTYDGTAREDERNYWWIGGEVRMLYLISFEDGLMVEDVADEIIDDEESFYIIVGNPGFLPQRSTYITCYIDVLSAESLASAYNTIFMATVLGI